MGPDEFNSKVGKILGIKSGKVAYVEVKMRIDDHLNQRISLGIIPSKRQAIKLRDLSHEFGNVTRRE